MESESAEPRIQQAHAQLILINRDSSTVNDKNREPRSLGEEKRSFLSDSQMCHCPPCL